MSDFNAEDARQVLSNAAYKLAFTRMADHIDARAMACDVDNKDHTQRLIITKQLLAGIKREFERMIMEGEAAKIKLPELETRRSLFRR